MRKSAVWEGKPLPATGVGFTTGVAAVVVATRTIELVVELVVDEAAAEFVHCPACFNVVPPSQQYASGV